jgi:hypothetical protein
MGLQLKMMGTVTKMHLTRLKAGHYIMGQYAVVRHYEDDTILWTVREKDGEVWVVDNLDKARELLTKLTTGA